MNSKNHNGQMLIEVMLALAIMGIVLTPLLSLQTQVMQSVMQRDDHVRRLFEAEQFLATMHRTQPEDTKQATIQEKGLKYELLPIQSATFKNLPDLYREQVTYTWQRDNKQQRSVRSIFSISQKR